MKDPHPVRSYQWVDEAMDAIGDAAGQLYELSYADGLLPEHKALLATAMHALAEQVGILYQEAVYGSSFATQSYCTLVR